MVMPQISDELYHMQYMVYAMYTTQKFHKILNYKNIWSQNCQTLRMSAVRLQTSVDRRVIY